MLAEAKQEGGIGAWVAPACIGSSPTLGWKASSSRSTGPCCLRIPPCGAWGGGYYFLSFNRTPLCATRGVAKHGALGVFKTFMHAARSIWTNVCFFFFFCNSHASMLRKEQGIHASFACICSYPHWVPEAGGSRKQARSIRRGDVVKKKKQKKNKWRYKKGIINTVLVIAILFAI